MEVRPTLGGFLQTRRARINPQSVGVRGISRRRVPGLRREELAQLAGISVEYYQRLEQGRAARPSDEVLDALARTLGLDQVERAHLNRLAYPQRGVDAPHAHRAAGQARPELRRMLTLMDKVPALIVNDQFDVLAANPLATRLFADATSTEPGTPNLARYLFLDPRARDFYLDWDDVAIATAGQLRLSSGRHPADQDLATLIAGLTSGSEDFRTRWAAGHVEQRSAGIKRLRHPAVGLLTLHYENFASCDDARQRLITFIPEEHGATEAALRLLASPRLAPPGDVGGGPGR